MSDVIYNFFTNGFGVSPLNTALLVTIFFLVKQRLEALTQNVEWSLKRVERAERTLLKAGIELLELED